MSQIDTLKAAMRDLEKTTGAYNRYEKQSSAKLAELETAREDARQRVVAAANGVGVTEEVAADAEQTA